MIRWMAIADTHGDQLDREAWSVQQHFAASWKPDLRLHLGDVFDFRWLRRGASDAEKAEDVAADIEVGLEVLETWKPHVVLWGNHDARLWRALEESHSDGALRRSLRMIIEQIDAACVGVTCIPYNKRDGVYQVGNTLALHGYASGVNAPRKMASVYGSCLFGHLHRVAAADDESHAGRRVAYSVGCACKLEMPYNAAQIGTLKQAHGFAYGIVKDGFTHVYNACKVGGTWYLPTEFREFTSERQDARP